MVWVLVPVLAALAAILGYLMDNVWLLSAGAAVLALALLALLVLAIGRRRRRAAAQQRPAPLSREDELRSLGISDIRPRGESLPDPDPAASAEVSGGAAVTPEDGPLPERASAAARPPNAPAPRALAPRASTESTAPTESVPPPVPALPLMLEARDDSPFWHTHSPTAVTSLLRALWAATDVQTVALFSTDASGLTLEVALSHNPAAHREGRFPKGNASFLDAASPDRPLTVLGEGDPLLAGLPHYKHPVPLGGAAVLPVATLPGGPVHLVVDLAPDQLGFSERQRGLLVQYAGLLGAMLDPAGDDAPAAAPTRREIIAAEMERARDSDRPLALALVYLSDAERLSAEGAAAVAEAERHLRQHLEAVSPGSRVETFGELMAGVFLYADAEATETWAARVHADDLPLAVGIARLAPHHRDADALRADAANALQEALAAEEHYVIG